MLEAKKVREAVRRGESVLTLDQFDELCDLLLAGGLTWLDYRAFFLEYDGSVNIYFLDAIADGKLTAAKIARIINKRKFPFPCESCGKSIVRPISSAGGDGRVHGGHGFCTSCLPVLKMKKSVCSSCERDVLLWCRGLCKSCYEAWRRSGRPEPVQDFRYAPRNR